MFQSCFQISLFFSKAVGQIRRTFEDYQKALANSKKEIKAVKKDKSKRASAFYENKCTSPTSHIDTDMYDDGPTCNKKKKKPIPEKKEDLKTSFISWVKIETQKSASDKKNSEQIHEIEIKQKLELELNSQYLQHFMKQQQQLENKKK